MPTFHISFRRTIAKEYTLASKLLFLVWVIVLSSCSTLPQQKNYSIPIQYSENNTDSTVQEHRKYSLQPHDKLDVMFHFNTIQTNKYRIHAHDRLNIKFPTVPEYDGEYQVRPDGFISLPLVGDYRVQNLTVAELHSSLVKEYASHLKRPRFFISIAEFQVHLKQIRESLRHPTMGLARLLVVRDDYNITIPYIGEISVEDKTIEMVTEEANTLFRESVPGLSVDILLNEKSTQEIFVFGEVKNPGRHIIKGEVSILKAMALAGGVNEKANLNNVVTLTKKKETIVAQQHNFRNQLKGEESVVMLGAEDILFVPQSKLSSAAQTMQYIAEVLLFEGIDLGYSYRLNSN